MQWSANPRRAQLRTRRAVSPTPGVAKPDGRQQVERRRVRPAVDDRNAGQNVVGIVLGVLDEDIEIAVVVEDAGVHQFEFGLQAGAMSD